MPLQVEEQLAVRKALKNFVRPVERQSRFSDSSRTANDDNTTLRRDSTKDMQGLGAVYKESR